jgi:hypothetical protein
MQSKFSMTMLGVLVLVFLAANAWAAPVSITPPYGGYMFYLGTVDANGDDLNDYTGESGFDGYSTLNFTVTDVTSVEMSYYFLSWDYSGFDEPGFFIEVSDGTPINPEGLGSGPDALNQGTAGYYDRIEWWASDVDTDGPEAEPFLDFSNGWQTYTASGLDPFTTYFVTIGAGNTQDGSLQSFAFLDAEMAVPQNPSAFGDLPDNVLPEGFIAEGQYGFIESFESDGIGYSEVPVPAAFWLLGSGLLGLLGLRRKFSG